MTCVNALNGLISFLPHYKTVTDEKLRKCVNALNGLISFLPAFTSLDKTFAVMCQCPKRANLISTHDYHLRYVQFAIRCQCPKRANLISTDLYSRVIMLNSSSVSMP